VYSVEDSLEEFAKTYAEAAGYADSLSKILNVPKTTKLKEIPINNLMKAVARIEDHKLFQFIKDKI
jgi:hypothetical protein